MPGVKLLPLHLLPYADTYISNALFLAHNKPSMRDYWFDVARAWKAQVDDKDGLT